MTELLGEKGTKILLADLPKKVSGLTCFVKRPHRYDVRILDLLLLRSKEVSGSFERILSVRKNYELYKNNKIRSEKKAPTNQRLHN
jgi:hypothetical protein